MGSLFVLFIILDYCQYVIDGYCDFDTVADGARPSSSRNSGIHLQFDHDDVMEMGKYFYEEVVSYPSKNYC